VTGFVLSRQCPSAGILRDMPLNQSGLVTPPAATVAAVRALLAREGLANTCALLGISRNTVDRIRGGLPIHRGTFLVVREALAPIAPTVQR
jgi:hypothetical protein